jgi:CheY-like chemotaxis protein
LAASQLKARVSYRVHREPPFFLLAMHDPAGIFIVDDNPTNRDILATRLAMHGYDLSQAVDGEEALAAVKTLVPDLVLLDVMMPKLHGIDACRLVKNDPTLPFIPIMLVTAKADTEDVIAGLEAGADEHLTDQWIRGHLWRGCARCCGLRRCTIRPWRRRPTPRS